jgi:heme-degrading monooxygenase HmoA
MVLEVALIDVMPGSEEAFRTSYGQAREVLAGSPGCRRVRMTQGIETPTRFVLLVEWDEVAAHDAFRAGEEYGKWRALIGPHFANPPHVEHFDDL